MMKKIYAMLCIVCLLALTACGAVKAESTGNTTTAPLTYSGEVSYDKNYINTEEGVVIMCSSNYVLGPEAHGQFVFMLSETAREHCCEDEFDWASTFVSNGKIYKVDLYDYKDNIIATEECDGAVTIEQDYKDATYIDNIVIYIEYNGNHYTADFARSGA